MDKYYYLVSQLPMLEFNREASVTVDSFLDEANKWLSEKDFKFLSQVSINDFKLKSKDNKVYMSFKSFENELRTDVALWREAFRKDLEYKPVSFPASTIKEGNPLEVEIKLLELRWKYLEEMESSHHFDIGYLILYYLKLQILQRLFTFNKQEGLNKFQKLYEVNV